MAKAGLLLALDGAFASPVWLGSGTALCILLFNGYKMWPAIALGSFIVNWISGSSVGFACVASFGNTLEALVAFHIIIHFKSRSYLFVKLKGVFVFLCSTCLAAIIGALFGGLAFILFYSKEINLLEVTGTWWIGDFTSFLLIVPIVFLLNKSAFTALKTYTTLISVSTLILASYMTFLVNYEFKTFSIILQYTLVVFAIVAAVTQNRIATLIHVLIIEGFALVATCLEKGPFVFPDLNTNLLFLQSFMAILTIVTLIISVGLREKELIENKLKVTLAEKEMLISEIHHRIKNNLAIVSSLLYLQNETIEDKEIRDKINQTDLRIKTIALVHEKLYAKHSVNNIEFSNYLESLAKMICRGFEKDIKLALNLEKISLTIEKAQPLGLIINELLTNSFKHAFTATENAEIEIRLKKNGNNYWLMYRDNGTGIEHTDKKNTGSLGLTLIQTLANQIDATYTIKSIPGTTYEFSFK